MKELLNGQIKLYQAVLLAIVVALVTGVGVVGAAALANGFWDTGTVQMTAESAGDIEPQTVPTGPEDTSVLHKTIKIPEGTTAEITVTGSVYQEGVAGRTNRYCLPYLRLGKDKKFNPVNLNIETIDSTANYLALPVNGYLTRVQPGTYTIHLMMQSGLSECTVVNRTMLITANFH